MANSVDTRFLRPLLPRDPKESHRVASPLELLTDLCFVVAIALAAAELHHHISDHHTFEGILGFVPSFFAIFWAWLNFTWFASAYANDDVGYRLLIIGQIVGSLILAAGVPAVFQGDLTLTVIGYVIMRMALVALWVRAYRADPDRRRTLRRYIVGITLVQAYWLLLLGVLSMAPGLTIVLFLLGVVLEFLVPWVAERAGATTWHPHHVAERYGLFFIIVLGEMILSITMSIQGALSDDQVWTSSVLLVALSGILIVFGMWWIYFSRPATGAMLRPEQSTNTSTFVWGFAHYLIFAGAAAVGAGLAARVDFWSRAEHHGDALTTGLAVTIPTSVVLAVIWAVQLRGHDASPRTWLPFLIAVLLIMAGTFSPVPELAAGIVVAVLVVVELRVARIGVRS